MFSLDITISSDEKWLAQILFYVFIHGFRRFHELWEPTVLAFILYSYQLAVLTAHCYQVTRSTVGASLAPIPFLDLIVDAGPPTDRNAAIAATGSLPRRRCPLIDLSVDSIPTNAMLCLFQPGRQTITLIFRFPCLPVVAWNLWSQYNMTGLETDRKKCKQESLIFSRCQAGNFPK